MNDDRQVSYQEGKDFADSLGMNFLETSAKSKINIEETFKNLTLTMLPLAQPAPKNKGGKFINLNIDDPIGITRRSDNKNKDGCGC